jgi:hypothetical protein
MKVWTRANQMLAMWNSGHRSRSLAGLFSIGIAYAPKEVQTIIDDLIAGKITQSECWDRMKPYQIEVTQ